MLHRIANKRLECQRGQEPTVIFGRNIYIEEQFIGIAHLKELTIRAGKLHLLLQRGGCVLAVLNDVAEGVRELVDICQRLILVLLAHQHRERVERIEEEVGAYLSEQHIVSRLEILRAQLLIFEQNLLLLKQHTIDSTVENGHHKHNGTLQHYHPLQQHMRRSLNHHQHLARAPVGKGCDEVEYQRRHDNGRTAKQITTIGEVMHIEIDGHNGQQQVCQTQIE